MSKDAMKELLEFARKINPAIPEDIKGGTILISMSKDEIKADIYYPIEKIGDRFE